MFCFFVENIFNNVAVFPRDIFFSLWDIYRLREFGIIAIRCFLCALLKFLANWKLHNFKICAKTLHKFVKFERRESSGHVLHYPVGKYLFKVNNKDTRKNVIGNSRNSKIKEVFMIMNNVRNCGYGTALSMQKYGFLLACIFPYEDRIYYLTYKCYHSDLS